MKKSMRLLIIAGLAVTGVLGGLMAMQSMAAAETPASPAPCICSAVQKLEFSPVSPAEPLARMYVAHCQCGNLNCVVTNGALQCSK
jgi:hypothetical protein